MYLNSEPPAGPQRSVQARELLAAADAAEMAANATTTQQERRAVMAVLAHKEAMQIGLIQAQMNRLSQTPRTQERLPIREDGDDIGRVEARIPKHLFFHLLKQKNFGWEGLTSDEGMRDLLKTHPACRIKTVSGKTVVGWRDQKPETKIPGRAVFGRGTLVLAK